MEKQIKSAIQYFENFDQDCDSCSFNEGEHKTDGSECYVSQAVCLTIQALNEMQARENPKPLSLEQLKERKNKPVYIDKWGWEIVEEVVEKTDLAFGRGDKWCVRVDKDRFIIFDDFAFYDFEPKNRRNNNGKL